MRALPSQSENTNKITKGSFFAVAIFIIGILQFHWTEISSSLSKTSGGITDPRYITYLLEHFYTSLSGEGRIWHSPPVFFPEMRTIGYSDLLLGLFFPYSIFRLVGLSEFSAGAATILLLSTISFVAMYIFIRRAFALSSIGAAMGAYLFAFGAPRALQLIHWQMLFTPLVPIAFWLAYDLILRGMTLDSRQILLRIFGISLSIILMLYTSFYIAWFVLYFFIIWAILMITVKSTRILLLNILISKYRFFLASLLISLLLLLPFFWIYLPVLKMTGGREFQAVLVPTLNNFLYDGDGLIWHGTWLSKFAAPPADSWAKHELALSLGVPALILALISIGWSLFIIIKLEYSHILYKNIIDMRNLILSTMFLANILFSLSFVMISDEFSVWRYVQQIVPGGSAIRGAGRFALVAALPVAIFVAMAFDAGWRWLPSVRRPLVRGAAAIAISALALFMCLEQVQRSPVGGVVDGNAEIAFFRSHAARIDPDCDVMYMASRGKFELITQTDAMWIAHFAGIPTLNGLSGWAPRHWRLSHMSDPDYEKYVEEWVFRNSIRGRVCRLFVARPWDPQ